MVHLTFKHPISKHTQLKICTIINMRTIRWPRSGIPTKYRGLLSDGLLEIHPLTRLPVNGDEQTPENVQPNVYKCNYDSADAQIDAADKALEVDHDGLMDNSAFERIQFSESMQVFLLSFFSVLLVLTWNSKDLQYSFTLLELGLLEMSNLWSISSFIYSKIGIPLFTF